MALVDTITSLLDAYGVDVSLQKRVVSAHSPVSDTVLATNTSQTARCFVITKTAGRNIRDLVSMQRVASVSEINAFFGPSPVVSDGDSFTLNNQKYSIQSVGEIAFAGSIVGYKVTATR